jgi:hypothetical protein
VSRAKIVHERIALQNGYARFCPANRNHGGHDIYLGTVVDLENGIFYNRKKGGYFQFTVKDGYKELSADEIEYWKLMKNHPNPEGILRAKLTLDFGDAWILEHFFVKSELKPVFSVAYPEDIDTLLSLVAFKLLDTSANCYASGWQEGSYNRFLYPKATLQSQRISEFVERLGDEENTRRFFEAYFSFLKRLPNSSDNILLDSTGLPNDIQFSLTALNNHNGVYSREVRLIFVVDRQTGYPVYFRCVAGNIVDVTTLTTTISELKAQGISVKHGIFDAGYYSEPNITALYEAKIPFLLRLPDNRSLFEKVLREHRKDIETPPYLVKYADRVIFMKRVKEKLFGYDGFVYIAIDFDRKNDEQRKYYKAIREDIFNEREAAEKLQGHGVFMLVSSEEIDTKEILPLYYNRETIEQIFDLSKNEVGLLPLRNHKMETFRGHILLSFMATILHITIDRMMKPAPTKRKLKKPKEQFCTKAVFHAFRNVKCNVYGSKLVTNEPNKIANKVLNHLKLELPKELTI